MKLNINALFLLVVLLSEAKKAVVLLFKMKEVRYK